MAVLTPAEFKKLFEKSEKYNAIAVEIGKFFQLKTAWKDAQKKSMDTKVSAARAFETQAAKTAMMLKTWEAGLSAPFKALAAQKKVLEEAKVEKAAAVAAKTKIEQEQLAAEEKTRSIKGKILAQKTALANFDGDFVKLDAFLKDFNDIASDVAAGKADSKETLRLASAAKPLVELRNRLKAAYDKTKTDFSALLNDKTIVGEDRTELQKFIADPVDKNLNRLKPAANLEAIIVKLSASRKKLYDDKSGLIALAKRNAEQGVALLAAIDKWEQTIASYETDLQSIVADYPDPAKAKLMDNDLRNKVHNAQGRRTTLKKRDETVKATLADLGVQQKQFMERNQKLLDSATYKALAGKDNEAMAHGAALRQAMKNVSTRLSVLTRKANAYVANAVAGRQQVQVRYLEYADIQAKKTLAKKEKQKQ